jgi:hypothetical protein
MRHELITVTIKTPNYMMSLLVFNRLYRLEIQSVMLVFSTQLCGLLSLQPSLWFTLPHAPSQRRSTVYTDSVWLGGGGGGC